MLAGQPDLGDSSLKLSSQVILGCVKVTVETNQDSSYNNYGNKIPFSALSLKKNGQTPE